MERPRHVNKLRLAIVGAGIAGLAAARQAIRHGLDVVVFEATDRIGGRLQTIVRDDGSVWDAGAHWLLQPAINPLVREAERLPALLGLQHELCRSRRLGELERF